MISSTRSNRFRFVLVLIYLLCGIANSRSPDYKIFDQGAIKNEMSDTSLPMDLDFPFEILQQIELDKENKEM